MPPRNASPRAASRDQPPVPVPLLVLLTAAGGALGGAVRAGLGLLLPAPGGLPLATLAANLAGCLAVGLLLGLGPGPRLRAFAGTGLLGGFTTWSALALETDRLLPADPLLGAGYLLGSCASGVLLAVAGRRLAQGYRS